MITHSLESEQKVARERDICQGDAFANQESARREIGVQRGEDRLQLLLGALNTTLIRLHQRDGRVSPSAHGGQNFRLGNMQPRDHLGVSTAVSSTTAQLIAGHVQGDGICVEQLDFVVLEGRNATIEETLLEVGSLVRLAVLELRRPVDHLQVRLAVRRSDTHNVRTHAVLTAVQSLRVGNRG